MSTPENPVVLSEVEQFDSYEKVAVYMKVCNSVFTWQSAHTLISSHDHIDVAARDASDEGYSFCMRRWWLRRATGLPG